jgi:signal transduction histidine kinase
VGRLLLWFALAAGLAAGSGAVLHQGGELSLAGPDGAAQVLAVLAGAVLVLVPGVLPAGTPGALALAAAGALWLVAEWANPVTSGSVPFTAGLLATGGFVPVLLVGGLPPALGRGGTLRRLAVLAAAVSAGLSGLVHTILVDPRVTGCPACPRDLVALGSGATEGVGSSGAAVLWIAAGAGAIAALLALGACRPTWRARWPMVAAVALATVAAGAESLTSVIAGQATGVGYALHALTAVGLLVLAAGVLRAYVLGRLALRAVVRALVDLDGRPTEPVELVLRRALDDSELRLAYPSDPAGSGWLDGDSSPVELPEDATTIVADAGRPLVALVHGRRPSPDPAIVLQAVAGARLQLDVERIRVGQHERVAELAAARIRVVDASDAARTRLERDLHDGAQQRLVALRYTLGVARSRADRAGDSVLAATLAEADASVDRAVVELRELAHGLGGSAIASIGFVEAVRSAADRCGATVVVTGTAPESMGAGVERASYAAVLEGLAATDGASGGPAVVRLELGPETVTVRVEHSGNATRVGAFDVLVDRVQVLGGRIWVSEVEALPGRTELGVELPCA